LEKKLGGTVEKKPALRNDGTLHYNKKKKIKTTTHKTTEGFRGKKKKSSRKSLGT